MLQPHDYSGIFRKLRQESGHTQESLALSLGVSTSVINRIENNKRHLTMDIVSELPKAFNKSEESIAKDLNSINTSSTTVNSSIKENHGTGVNVEAIDLKMVKELYKRMLLEKDARLAEKDKYISALEAK
jgi:transcriptional regulator with XRE-family HTH domain